MVSPNGRIPVFTDSANSLNILYQEGYTRTTRWLDNCYLFVADMIKKNIIKISHITGTQNPADSFTKLLEQEAFRTFLNLLGITSRIKPQPQPSGET
ncbi:hypothetical protein BO71DRAFT_400789 [Aspergillus ellipticus CBS 707.79]|uniref:RNase H type-1 domain-containing protein n=1 Tax=Aspergillus ellipticus CBS 707.79 TaxID=1448320 RepID=A0A319D3W2_9EURO|nr:hypothetical protein BO71DRAFT_400789 [Aspergillus ellipticus CBS 707.79]